MRLRKMSTNSLRSAAAMTPLDRYALSKDGTLRDALRALEFGDGELALALEGRALLGVVTDGDVRHLHWLGDRLGDDLADAIVVTTGPDAYRRPDGVGVVPAGLLGP